MTDGPQHPSGTPAYPGGPGNLGPMPGSNDPGQQPRTVPADVDKAWKLWLASIVIGLIGTVVGLLATDRDKLKQDLIAEGSAPADVDAVVNATVVSIAVIGLIILALQLLFVFKMRAGRNWARIVLTVLGVVGVLSSVFSLSQGSGLAAVVNLVSAVVVVAAIVLMYRPAAKAYFSPQRY
ncbi:hypothetical protein [Rhodococcus sp. X156]|uniref:hypothetical protein n=1 Tax=Rhodococcus sp. X156 TaxID=2499145 RepID=UPI000FD7C294|nr:hypothetical protein [Rhodococcus sp. X156]